MLNLAGNYRLGEFLSANQEVAAAKKGADTLLGQNLHVAQDVNLKSKVVRT